MTPERADYHLLGWARWMRAGRFGFLRVQLMSLEAGYSHSTDFDAMIDAVDVMCAQATNAVVLDLKPLPKQAIKAFYLGERWTENYLLSPLVSEGVEAVASGLRRRGIL